MSEKKPKSEWVGIISDWKQSGLSRGEYCKKNRLILSTFDYWKRKINKTDPDTRLVKVDLPLVRPQSSSYSMKITTRDFAVEIASGIPAGEIRTLLTACKELL